MWAAKFELEMWRALSKSNNGFTGFVFACEYPTQPHMTFNSLCYNFIEQVGVTQVISWESNIVDKSAIRGLWSLNDSLIVSVTGLHEKSKN